MPRPQSPLLEMMSITVARGPFHRPVSNKARPGGSGRSSFTQNPAAGLQVITRDLPVKSVLS